MITSSFIIVRNFQCFLNLSLALHTGCSSDLSSQLRWLWLRPSTDPPPCIEKKPLTPKLIHSTSSFTLEEHQVGALMRASPLTNVDQVRISASTSYVVCYKKKLLSYKDTLQYTQKKKNLPYKTKKRILRILVQENGGFIQDPFRVFDAIKEETKLIYRFSHG